MLIADMLKELDLNKLEQQAFEDIRSGKVTKRKSGVKMLRALSGLKRAGATTDDLILDRVPVIPPQFRPFTMAGSTFVPGDANELYADLIKARSIQDQADKVLGRDPDAARYVRSAVKAAFGYGDSPNPKIYKRRVSGLMTKILGCHDDQTEILTRKYGWVLFKDLPEDTEVATVNPRNNSFEWQQPTAYTHAPYEGVMIHFSQSKRVDALVTPDHDMYLKKRVKGTPTDTWTEMNSDWHMVKAYQTACTNGRIWFMTSPSKWDGGSAPVVPTQLDGWSSMEFAEICGWWLSEGWLTKGVPGISQSVDANPLKHARITELMSKLNTGFRCYHKSGEGNRGASTDWYFGDEIIGELLVRWFGSGAANKTITPEVRDWDSAHLNSLVKGYLLGDGTGRQEGNDTKRPFTPYDGRQSGKYKTSSTVVDNFSGYSTTSKSLVDALSEVFAKLGCTAPAPSAFIDTRNDNWKPMYYVPVYGRFTVGMDVSRHSLTGHSLVNYKGHVHCCTVPNQLLLTRRNGKILVSGNSGPKTSWVQSKLISKPQDMVGRSVISPDPTLGMDEIGLPEAMAWEIYSPRIRQALVARGVPSSRALKLEKDRDPLARQVLETLTKKYPVTASRSPAWHHHNYLAFWPKITDGDNIFINTYVTAGYGADFDGDQQINTVFAAIPNDLPLQKGWTDLGIAATNTGMFQKLLIPVRDDDKRVIITDLEDFPRTAQLYSKEGVNGPIHFLGVPAGTQVLALNETTNKPVWANVSFYSEHPGRVVEIVNLTNRRQIITDNDPRAVFGVCPDDKELVLRRFTPTEALAGRVCVPVVTRTDLPVLTDKITVGGAGVVLDFDFGYLLGALCGDGWWDKKPKNIKLSGCAGSKAVMLADLQGFVAEVVTNTVNRLFDSPCRFRQENFKKEGDDRYGDTVKYSFVGDAVTKFADFLAEHLGGTRCEKSTGSANKRIPGFAYTAPREFREGLVCGLMDTDGTCCVSNAKGRPQLMCAFSSTSLRLAREFAAICRTLGMRATVSFSKETSGGNTSWIATISSLDAKREGLFSRLASPWKREAFENTPVSETGGSELRDAIPLPDAVAEVLKAWIPHPKAGNTEKSMSPKQKLRRSHQRNISGQLYDARSRGLVARQLALKLLQEVRALYAEAGADLERAKKALRDTIKDGIFDGKRSDLVRDGVRAVAPFAGDAVRYRAGCAVVARVNAPLRAGGMSSRVASGLLEWLETTPRCPDPTTLEPVTTWERHFVENTDVEWAVVESVEYTGKKEDGYDLTVPGYETFMSADGVILSNTMAVHLPYTKASMADATDRLLPSKLLFSVRNRDRTLPQPKHEQLLGLASSQLAPSGNVHSFPDRASAMKAISDGTVKLQDQIDLPD
jgi:hypothetical protein